MGMGIKMEIVRATLRGEAEEEEADTGAVVQEVE